MTEVKLWLCECCLDGKTGNNGYGGRCDVPACALRYNRAPDRPITRAVHEVLRRYDYSPPL